MLKGQSWGGTEYIEQVNNHMQRRERERERERERGIITYRIMPRQ